MSIFHCSFYQTTNLSASHATPFRKRFVKMLQYFWKYPANCCSLNTVSGQSWWVYCLTEVCLHHGHITGKVNADSRARLNFLISCHISASGTDTGYLHVPSCNAAISFFPFWLDLEALPCLLWDFALIPSACSSLTRRVRSFEEEERETGWISSETSSKGNRKKWLSWQIWKSKSLRWKPLQVLLLFFFLASYELIAEIKIQSSYKDLECWT